MSTASAHPHPTVDLLVDAKATLGEGPYWCTSLRQLYWVDILNSRLHRFDPVSKRNLSWDIGEHVGTVVTRAKGGVMLAVKRGLAHYDLESRTLRLLSQPEQDRPNNRFNDGKCDPAGRLWAGTLAYDDAPGVASLYRLDPDGSTHVMQRDVTCSNGLAWDLSKKLFYYIDSPTRTIVAYDYDHASGAIRNRRVVIICAVSDGFPDGMAIDVDGKLWVAHWGGSQVVRWDPDTGAALKRIPTPVSRPTACSFGGANLDQLYITSARVGLTEQELAKEPLAGGLFVVDPQIRGIPHTPYAG